MQHCIVCLEEESIDRLIYYNHCGKYYIHSECLSQWTLNECIICRNKIDELPIGDSNEYSIYYTCYIIMLGFSGTAFTLFILFII